MRMRDPDMTGIEPPKRILPIRPDIPIILCAGVTHLGDADSAKAAGHLKNKEGLEETLAGHYNRIKAVEVCSWR